MVKVILVIFVSGMRFQCHYNNIIKLYFIVSRKESVKSFLTLMTNDQMTAFNDNDNDDDNSGQQGHWSLWSFRIFNSHNHKCRETSIQHSGKVLHYRSNLRTFASDFRSVEILPSLITKGGFNL